MSVAEIDTLASCILNEVAMPESGRFSAQAFVLSHIVIDPVALTLTAPQQAVVSIQQKPMEVLQFLAQQYPSLVSREQLITAVWDGNSYVGEKALTNAIWQLRHQLQQLGAAELISTIRKKGYRLQAAPVMLSSGQPTGVPPVVTTGIAPSPVGRPFAFAARVNPWWLAVGVLLPLLIWGLWWLQQPAGQVLQQQLTQGSGRALFPSLSDDGRYLAFSWRKFEQGTDLYLLDLQQPQQPFKQLTFSPDNESRPVWGRDQQHLYYSVNSAVYGRCKIMRLDLRTLSSTQLASCNRHSSVYLDVSPDGRYLLFNGTLTKDGRSLYQLDLQNSEAKPVALPCQQNCQHRIRDLAFSPDGRSLAITRRANALSEQVYLHQLATGEEVQLTSDEEDILGMEWHPDGERLVYGALRHGKRHAVLLNIRTKQRQNLGVADFAGHTRITRAGELYFHRLNSSSQLAYLPLSKNKPGTLFPLTASDERYESPDYNPSRQALVYVSNSSGYMELWQADADMQNPKQLTSLQGVVKYPRWSRHGDKVLFVARFAGEQRDRLMLLDITTGQLTTLETGIQWHRRPSWWHQDQGVVFRKGNELFLLDLATHQQQQLTHQEGVYAAVTDGGKVYFSKGTNRGLFQLLPDGSEQQLLDGEQFSPKYAWTVVGEDVYFLQHSPNQLMLSRYDSQSRQVTDIQLLSLEYLYPFNSISYDVQRQRLLLELSAMPRADIVKLEHPLLK